MDNQHKQKYVPITRDDEHKIRRALMIGRGGFEWPPEEGHERQEDGWFPFLPTLALAQVVAYEMLALKAENLEMKAKLARRYVEEKRIELGQRGLDD